MKVRISGRTKYAYLPNELREEESLGVYEVTKGVGVLVLIRGGSNRDEVIQSLGLILEALKLRREAGDPWKV